MAVEANALLDLVSKAVSLVQSAGRGWYKNSKDIESFAEQVRVLRRKADNWARLLKKYGPTAQNLVGPLLEEALETLEQERASMRFRQASCWLRWSYRTLNIGDASIAIQNVSQAFEGISQSLEEHVTADRNLNRITTNSLASLPFRSDQKYVPLLEPLEAVQRALESMGGAPVVTLYGQPGSGKTMMAKYLAIHYDEIRRQQEAMPSLGDLVAEKASNCFSDGVMFLTCGPEGTSKGLHEELWQNLGFSRAMFDLDTQQENTFGPRFDQEWYSESMLHKQLMGRLENSSMLIILDDVWETKVLERLLLPGNGLKYLVTSQYRRVWEDAVQINITKPNLTDARKILVNHVVGLPVGKVLPPKLQAVADDVIQASEFTPLVLANLALAISSERATNLDEWITVRKYLLELLDDDDKSPLGYDKTYPQTVASTMTMAVNSMSVETKNLLFLAAVCDGPSVPETVLKILFKGLVGSLARFQKWSNYLEDRDFIQIQTHVVDWTDVPQKTWSLHLLRQHFVRVKKTYDVSSMLSVLFGAKNKDSDIVSALFALFAVKSYTEENAAEISEPLSISWTRGTNDEGFSRKSIKPFVWLLHADSNEVWQRNAYEMATKIITGYVRCGELEDTSLSSLLQMPEAQSATCWALKTTARLEKRALLNERHEGSLRSLLALLGQDAERKTQSWGALALGALAVKNHEIILAQPLALKNLLRLVEGGNLAKFDDENLQQRYAARALGNLAVTSTSKNSIADYPGILDALLKLLDSNDYPDVQVAAAYSLRRLAYGEQVTTENQSRQMKMIVLPGLLEKLVQLLNRGTDPDVQKEVVWLLGNLAESREDKIVIGGYPKLLDRLVVMLDTLIPEFDTQRYHAVYALRRLTLKEPNPKLGRIPGAVESLVELLFAFGRADVQKEAVHCLYHLAYPEENKIEFAAIPGAVDGLLGLILEHVSPSTQLIAIGTLANLMEADDNKPLIASEPRAIEGLVRMLARKGAPPEIQSDLSGLAAQCLLQLSYDNYENQVRIASFPGALEGLVQLLDSSNKRVQLLSAWTLNNLAEAQDNRTPIRAFARNLSRLLQAPAVDAELQGYLRNTLSLLLNSPVAPDSAGGGPFLINLSTDNEAIEDLHNDHNHYVPWEHLDPNGLPNTSLR